MFLLYYSEKHIWGVIGEYLLLHVSITPSPGSVTHDYLNFYTEYLNTFKSGSSFGSDVLTDRQTKL